MVHEYLEPTAAMRRNLALVVLAGVLVVALLEIWLKPTVLHFIDNLPICAQLPWWRGLLVSAICIFPLAALFPLFQARKLLRFKQWPLPGAWVLRRTPIQRGRVVTVRAYVLIFVGVVILGITPYLAWQVTKVPFFSVPRGCAANLSVNTDAPSTALRARSGLPVTLVS